MQVRTEIEIAAPVAEVWRVLLDFSSYPQWNPFLVEVRGEPRAGARFDITLSFPDSHREERTRRRLLKYAPESELRWLGHWGMKGLFDIEHFVRVEPRDLGTRLIQGADFSGILLKGMLEKVTHSTRGFVYMNQALKRRIETPASNRP
jgi:hypothetical protein